MFIMSVSMLSLTGHALTNSQMTNGIVNIRTYLKTLYTPISHENLYGPLAHAYILKLSHVQRFLFNL